MILVGLTGSIAMGKSETAKMFATRGIPVFDSDAVVHELYAKGGGAVAAISRLVPSVIADDAVDRNRLAVEIQRQPDLLKKVEQIVHPLVRQRQTEFVEKAQNSGSTIAVLDIPLLFETGRQNEVDKVLVVSAAADIQRSRALARPGMTAEKLDFILSKQVPDDQKRQLADYVVDTSIDLPTTARQIDRIIAELEERGRA